MAEHKSLAEALAAFQAVVPKMSRDEIAKVKGETKDGRAYDRSYGYASLDQFVEIVEPKLGAHGLSITSAPHFTDGRYVLVVTLLHESGEERTGEWPLPDPNRNGPQDIGSAMTYGRRYVGWGLTGTFPGGVDDDGQQAQTAARERWEDAKPRQVAQVMDQHARGVNHTDEPKPPKTSWTDAEVDEYHVKLRELPVDKAAVVYDWMATKDLHNRPIGKSGKTGTLVFALRLSDHALATETTLDDLDTLKATAEGRGLMKVKVSATETLEEVLFEARELAQYAADQTIPEETVGTDRATLVGE